MRAIISVSLRRDPQALADAGGADKAYPSDDDVRDMLILMGLKPAGYDEAAAATGDRPPPGQAFEPRPWMSVRPGDTVPHKPVSAEEQALPFVLSADEWTPNLHQNWALTELFRSLARPIFERMPYRTTDDLQKLETAWRHVIFASDLPATGTRFMVTRETNG